MDFSNFKIATKIGAGFATIVAMIIALGATAWFQLGAVAAGEAQLAVHNLPNVEMAGQIQSLVNAIRRLEARHVLSYDLKDKDALEQEMATDRQQLASIDPIASSRYASAQEQKAWSDYLVHRQQWYAEWDKLRPFSRKSNESQEAQDFAAKAFNSDSQAKFTLSLNDVQALSDYNRKVGAEAWTEGQQTIQVARWTVLIAIALAVLLAVALALVIAGAIARPIAAAVQVAGAIAQGDNGSVATGVDKLRHQRAVVGAERGRVDRSGERLRDSERHERKREDERDRQEEVERDPGDVDPEIADRLGRRAHEAAR